MEVLIVGAGAMGGWFARLFRKWGWEVWLKDVEQKKSMALARELGAKVGDEILPQADLVLVAVPISSTPAVLREVIGRMKKGALLLEVSSVKERVVSTMQELRSNPVELVALHPLFGPGAENLRGERFAFIPIRAGRVFKEIRNRLEGEGAILIKTKAEEHDSAMARAQALTHLLLLCYLRLCERGKLQTHLSATFLELAKAVLAGNPSVYYEVQALNRFSPKIRQELLQTWKRLDELIEAGKKEKFEKFFKKLKGEFGKEVEIAYRGLYAS
jgi:prephenate dehydrogenase